MNDTHKLGADDDLDYIGPIDADMALTAAYLAGEATPEQIVEFERRFVEDDDFYMYVAPAIKAWTLPLSFKELEARSAAHESVVRESAAQESAAQESAAPPTPAVAPPAKDAPRPASITGRRRYRRGVNAFNFVFKAVVAASLLITALTQLYIYFGMNRPDDVKVVRQALNEQQDAAAAAKAPRTAVATVEPRIPNLPGGAVIPAPGASRLAPPPQVATPPDTMADTSRTQAEVIRSGIIALGTEIRTGVGESKVIELRSGTRIALRPSTAIRQMRGMSLGLGSPEYVYVEGEIAVEIPPREPGTLSGLMILSAAGNLMARGPGILSDPGESKVSTSFAVRCRPPNCTALEVAVAEGHVSIFRGVDLTKGIDVAKGQFGLASGTELPTLVDSARAIGFPKPDPSIRKQP